MNAQFVYVLNVSEIMNYNVIDDDLLKKQLHVGDIKKRKYKKKK